MSDPTTSQPTGTPGTPWAALRTPPDVVRAATDRLRTARWVGAAITFVYAGYGCVAWSAGVTVFAVFAFVEAGLFAYGTISAAESPRPARIALIIGAVLGIPLGLTMLFLVRRIKEYEEALARTRRR